MASASASASKAEEAMKLHDDLDKRVRSWYVAVNAEFKKIDDLELSIKSVEKELRRTPRADLPASLQQALAVREANLKELRSRVCKESGGWFVELFLGRVNAKQYREGERFVMKNEYEKFKRKSAIPFAVLVILSFLLPSSPIVRFFLHIWSLVYFISLVLRESLLRVNGSTIRRWWIIHHYLSSVVSVVIILWPVGSASYQGFTTLFNVYLVSQLLVQQMQVHYQLGRLYSMVAMGKASPMDITGDTFQTPLAQHRNTWSPQLLLLYPFVTFVQGLQFLISYNLLRASWKSRGSGWQWQPIVVGTLFFALALGNVIATNKVYLIKVREHLARVRRDEQQQQQQHAHSS